MKINFELPECLKEHSVKQTPNQLYRGIVEIEGIEFAEFFVKNQPQATAQIIKDQKTKKSEEVREMYIDKLNSDILEIVD